MKLLTFKRKDDGLQYWIPMENLSDVVQTEDKNWTQVTYMDTKRTIIKVTIDQEYGIRIVEDKDVFLIG